MTTPTLVCLPGAGGDASMFRSWQSLLPNVEIHTPGRPGKGARWEQQPLDTVYAMAHDVLAQLDDRPVILLGFSLGALVAHEVTVELVREGRAPVGLIVAGSRAPDRPETALGFHELNDAALREAVSRLSPDASFAMQDDDLADILLPGIRADFAAASGYQRNPDEGDVLNVPILALAGDIDDVAGPDECRQWNRFTKGHFEFKTVAGGHDFFEKPHRAVAESVLHFMDTVGEDPHAASGPDQSETETYDPLRTSVRAAWATALNRTDFSDDTEFFAAGGSSVLAARVIAAVRKEIGVKVPLRKFLATPTVQGLAALVAEAQENA